MRATTVATALAAVLLLLTSVGAVAASRPGNDKRSEAVHLTGTPSAASGTTIRAQAEKTDPAPRCAPIGPTVWYRLVGVDGRTAVTLHALGQLEAVVAVYRVDRSQRPGSGVRRLTQRASPASRSGLTRRRHICCSSASRPIRFPASSSCSSRSPRARRGPRGTRCRNSARGLPSTGSSTRTTPGRPRWRLGPRT